MSTTNPSRALLSPEATATLRSVALETAQVYADEYPGEPLDPEWSAVAYEIDCGGSTGRAVALRDVTWAQYHAAVRAALATVTPHEYIAVASYAVGACEAVGWDPTAIAPHVLARGSCEADVLDDAQEAVGHDDVHVRRVPR